MSTPQARSIVARQLLQQIRVLRSGQDVDIAEAAIEAEKELAPILKKSLIEPPSARALPAPASARRRRTAHA
jgi:hypothetical protein